MREYQKIAVASTFSPRFLPVLAEAGRMTKRFACPLHVIHASPCTPEKEASFQEAFDTLGMEGETVVLWKSHKEPSEAILEAIREEAIDLLIAGALEKESELRHFTGGVARSLLRQARCDLLLLTHPRHPPMGWKKITAYIPPDGNAAHLPRVFKLAVDEEATHVSLISVLTPFDLLRNEEEPSVVQERIEAFCKDTGDFQGVVDSRIVRSNTGFSLCDVIQAQETDLFVVGFGEENEKHSMPSHMDWLFQVIPSDIWVIRNRL